ncbi:hypothetical protein Cfor_03519 [Coptotermes formosanus]|uniref:C2H2-type domain-containing protein n=1 Tax=Coptotermes formosanus TaxID=36987 RepID=A0A6L2PMJ5_COPFO|nr:hypothetical protein Cfor_03519 [Coptotermes formosanus]
MGSVHITVMCVTSHSVVSHVGSHQLIHTAERPYHCGLCNKSFKDQCNVKKRELLSNGERSYHCEVCSKSFNRKSHLKTHQRLHKGLHPYDCHVCKKSFSSNSELKKHQHMPTGECPHCCDACGKAFISKRYLKVHRHAHSAKLPFICSMCITSPWPYSAVYSWLTILTGDFVKAVHTVSSMMDLLFASFSIEIASNSFNVLGWGSTIWMFLSFDGICVDFFLVFLGCICIDS